MLERIKRRKLYKRDTIREFLKIVKLDIQKTWRKCYTPRIQKYELKLERLKHIAHTRKIQRRIRENERIHGDKLSKQTRKIERERREAERKHELELLKFKNTCQDKFGKKWKSCYDELKVKAQKALDERLEAEKSVGMKHHSSTNEFKRKVERLKKDLKKNIKNQKHLKLIESKNIIILGINMLS